MNATAKWGTLLVGLGVLSLALLACTPTGGPCGDFDYTGSEFDTATSNGVNMSLDFDLNPDECGSTATCDTVAYVQIVRTLDFGDFETLYPSSEKADRATASGWYIDRIAGKDWGYYGRNDDGSFASYLTVGSDTSTAQLNDSPRRPEAEPWLGIWWMAVSVPVCLDSGSTIVNNLAGYYFWSWIASDTGDVDDSFHTLAWKPQDQDFADAVAQWNTQAAVLGKNSFPAFVNLAP